jgi:hypothetical protein
VAADHLLPDPEAVRPVDYFDQLVQHASMTYDSVVPTLAFSPAKSRLSDLMDHVFHDHQPQLISRHGGKEQMVLLRPDDLATMLGDLRIEVRAVYDEGEVTLSAPEMGVLGLGENLEEATDDLLTELRAYAARFFRDPARYLATRRNSHAGALLRFALLGDAAQRAMLLEASQRSAPELVSAG